MNDHKSYCILWIVKFNSKIDKDRSINTQSKDQTFKRWAKKRQKNILVLKSTKNFAEQNETLSRAVPFLLWLQKKKVPIYKLTIEAWSINETQSTHQNKIFTTETRNETSTQSEPRNKGKRGTVFGFTNLNRLAMNNSHEQEQRCCNQNTEAESSFDFL